MSETHPTLSATDLANHLGCRHLTTLDLRATRGQLTSPTWQNPALDALEQRGLAHEAEYLDHLRAQGLSVQRVSGFDGTVTAMRAGAEVIVQAVLAHRPWHGRADVLRRVPAPSELGQWSYEVVDTKLARETRAGTILQLCLYSDMVGAVQGGLPERMHVVAPGNGFAPETFRVHDYLAYYRLMQTRLLDAVSAECDTYPEPVAQCDLCRWWPICDARWRQDDHLSLVAGISTLQRRELAAWEVQTLAALAQVPLPLPRRPGRGSKESLERVREQARVQLAGRERGRPIYELLPREPGRGLSLLPAPSPGDVFFDIEGDPFVGTRGLEYLLGWVTVDEGEPTYHTRWATSSGQERQAFEAFMGAVMERWAKYPDMHIYHFAPYEPGAIERLMGRYAVCEQEVDRLLRAGLFVDLFAVTRQAVRASVERYSIKDLEQFYGYLRAADLREASKSLRAFERALELGQTPPAGARSTVETYNRDDCLSTWRLRDWLESLRAELESEGEAIERPALIDGAPSEDANERQEQVQALMARLLEGIPPERAARTEAQHATWLLAHLLDWHRREEKAPWWEYFRLAALDHEDLLHENAALAGLELVATVGGTKACPIHRYRFPPQEANVASGSDAFKVGGDKLGKVVAIDAQQRTVDVKKRKDTAATHPTALFTHKVVSTRPQAEALLRLGAWVADHGVDAPGAHRAARDLLLSRAPRLRTLSSEGAPLHNQTEAPLDAAQRLALELQDGVLAIQGPPGAGKTHTGARMICALVRAGKKVGVTASSHEVIRNLLEKAVEVATEEGLAISCIRKVSDQPTEHTGRPIRETTANEDVVAALAGNQAQVAAGTPWLWAREDLFEAVDVLLVDEAGQMSLANVLAVAQAARSVVLLGDPQQLEQPLQGSHPEGTDASALQHLLGAEQTISAHRGLFLGETWRLHPAICALTSELFYEGRLRPRPNLHRQALRGESPFVGAGLWFVPVVHEGNQNHSPEEVEAIVALHGALTSDLTWVNSEGTEAPVTTRQVLIVAPYNAQVGALEERLPGARVGTVDKFQGQEAPVVIYSMATSSPEEAPRGMEFLFSLNRLNVATSRARCVCILVASPRLFELNCRTPRQMRLANAFCRYLELAKVA